MKPEENQNHGKSSVSGLLIGIGIGLCAGVVLGLWSGKMSIGLGVGNLFGVVLGIFLSQRGQAKRNESNDNDDDS